MAKLIELQEAAKILGVTPDELTEMRSRNEIFGYRDGSTWKFKEQEVERVKATLDPGATDFGAGINLGDDSSTDEADGADDVGLNISLEDDLVDADEESIDLDLSLDDDADVIDSPSSGDSDSILVSEEELGKSDDNTASTIIGEADDLIPGSGISESDALAGESDLELSLESSDIASNAMSESDILGDALESPPSASDTGKLNIASGVSDDDLKLSADSGSLELSLDDATDGGSRIEVSDDAQASSSGFGSAIDLGLDDDDLVLGSGSGSDITSGAGDSGINLSNPSDSGLSLEEPLDVSGESGIVESLELGEDDGGADEGGADDFMLEPVEDGLDEESDSGSQVIALDSEEFSDSDGFDDGGLGEEAFEAADDFETVDAGGGLEDDGGLGDEAALGAGAVAAAAGGLAAASAASGPGQEEASYSVWNVLSLFFIMTVLSLTGVMMLDLISNIWSWEGNFSFNSTLMDALLGMMPG